MYSKVIRTVFIICLLLLAKTLSAQYTIQTSCRGGEMMVSTILATADTNGDGTGATIPVADQSGGTFTSYPSGLGISINPTNDENGIISALPGDGTLNFVWSANGNSYTITINTSGTSSIPSVTTFAAENPSNCGATYDASARFNIPAGGAAPFTYVVEGTSPVATYTGTLNSLGLTTNVAIATGLTADNDLTLRYFADNTGCLSSNTPITTSYALTSSPVAQNVSWGSSCTSTATTIELLNSESGVTYQLRRDGSTVETWTSATGGAHTFTAQNTAGSYEIIAIDPCDGTTEIPMSGGAHVVYDPVTPQTVSVLEGAPICQGNPYTVTLGASETGVDYTISPLPAGVVPISGTGGAISFNTAVLSAGTYTISGSNACGTVNMSNTIVIGASSKVGTLVTSSVCVGTSLTIRVNGGSKDVDYKLVVDDGTSVTDVQTISNKGGTLWFDPVSAAGTYYVEVTNDEGCSSVLDGVCVISNGPTDFPLVTTGTVCPSGTVSIPSSEVGVDYILLRDGNPVITKPGTGLALSFGDQSVAGIYTIRGAAGSCINMMTGSLEVENTPTVLNLLVNKTKYCASEPLSDVNFSLGPIQADVRYMLQKYNGTTWDDDTEKLGNAGDVLSWANKLAGMYRVVASNDGGCSVTMSGVHTIEETVTPTADVTAQSPIRKCEGDITTFKIVVTFTGNPPYNFDLVDDKGNTIATQANYASSNYTISVNPSDAQTTYSIVNLTDVGSCSPVVGTTSATVYVDPIPSITFDPVNPQVCEGSTIAITANGAGAGGTYTWSDGLGAGQTITVGPNVPGKQYTVIAENVAGCTSSESVDVTVNPLPVVDWVTASGSYEYCENNPLVQLTGSPSGGSYSFNSTPVAANQFDPASADIGANKVTYQYTDTKGCTNSLTKDIVVNELPVVNITNLQTTYCSDAGTVTVNALPDGTSVGSTGIFDIVGYTTDKGDWWDATDGTATLNVGAAIAALGAPKNLTFRYTYTDPQGCTQIVEESTTLLSPLGNNIYFTNITATCEQDSPETLVAYLVSTGLPIGGGTFTGDGITDNANGTAIFTPGDAGSGSHTITYTYTDANNCQASTSQTIVLGTPLSINGLGTEYCSAQTTGVRLVGQVNGAPAAVGTTFFDIVYLKTSTNVVTKVANDTYDFVPATLAASYGTGEYDVIYTYYDGKCQNSVTTTVTIVESVDPSFTIDNNSGQTNFCINDDPIKLAPAKVLPSTAGSAFSGNGVGGAFFVPSDPNVKYNSVPNKITHTVTNIVNGLSCVTSTSRDVFVIPVDVAISGLSSTYCTDDNTVTITVNGADATDGKATFSATKNGSATAFLKDNADGKTATIDPGVGPGVYEVTMFFKKTTSDLCETTITVPVTVNASNPVTFSGISEGDTICKSSSDITLRGDMPNKGIGNFDVTTIGVYNTGTDDSGNTVAADDGVGILKPSEMPVGPYTITYVYQNEDGCITSESKTIEIVSSPSVLYNVVGGGAYCNDDVAPNKGVTIGLSGSNSGVTYELLRGGVSLSPKVEYTGDGNAFNFTSTGTAAGTDVLFTAEGYYTVSAISAGGCNAIMTGSALVEEYELVLELDTFSNEQCVNAEDGSVTLKTSGGSGAYEYSKNATAKLDGSATWQSSPTFNGLAPGTYKFSVRDLSSAACEKIQTITVVIAKANDIVITEDTSLKVNVGCTPCTAGTECEGSATITITGGTPDFATYPGVGYSIAWSTGGNKLTETGMPVGLHSVSVKDGNDCEQSINVEIFANDPITLTEIAAQHIDNNCNAGNTGTFAVIATGGSGTYQFNINNPATSPTTWVDSNFGGLVSEYKRSGLAKGSYDIWVRDKNPLYQRCITKIAVPIEITEPAALSLSVESQTPITCNGAGDATAIVRATGGLAPYAYEFTTDDPSLVAVPTWSAANDGTDGYELTLLSPGTHHVWVRDANAPTCDVATATITIADITPLSYTLVQHKNVSCNLGNDGRVEVLAQGGSGNYVYQWRDKAGVVISSDESAEGLSALDSPYELTITDLPNSCGPVVQSFVITEPMSALTVAKINSIDAACGGQPTGDLTISVSGGTAPYSITWSNGMTNVENIGNLSPGNYSAYVVDANGCIFDNSLTPWVIGQLDDITLVNPVTLSGNNCYGDKNGTLKAEVQGGSGLYEFRLEGPDIYDWTKPIPPSNSVYTFNNLLAGDYTLKVRDANHTDCEYTLGTYTITQPNQLTLSYNVSELVNVSCYGGNNGSIKVYALGGSGDYDYSLDNGATWTNIAQTGIYTFTGLSKGTYYIKVKDFNVGTCIGNTTLTVDITEPQEVIVAGVAMTPASCSSSSDGEVVITAQGGSNNYDYYCVETGVWQSSNTFILSPGKYTFMVQDAKIPGCISAPSDEVEVTAPMDFTTTSVLTHIKCYGQNTGQIALTTKYTDGSGGVFEYSIDNGVTFKSSPLTGLSQGVYDVIVKDISNGCTKSLATSLEILAPTQLTYSVDLLKDVSCYDEDNGEILLNVTGGTGTIHYQWTAVSDANGGKTNHVNNLEAGNYQVSISDDNGCSILPVPTFTIAEPDEIKADYTATHIAIGGQSTGSIVINTITGGPTSNYTVVWDDASTGMSRTGLYAGNYGFTVNVKDGVGTTICSRYYPVTLIDLSATLDFDLVATDAICNGADGNIEVKINSGNKDYTITWYKTGVEQGKKVTSNIITNISEPAGNYEVKVVDNVGASITKTVSIGQPDAFAIGVNIDDDIECFGDDASISLSVTGDAWDNAAAPKGDSFTVEWMDPDGLTFASGTVTAESVQSGLTKPGTYKAKVYHNTYPDCDHEFTVVLSDPLPLGIASTVRNVTCFGGNDGGITITPTGRTSGHGFTYSWRVSYDGGANWGVLSDNTASIEDKSAGLYEVTIQSTSSSCSYTSAPIQISEPAEITALVTNTNVLTCYGDDSGSIQLTNISGGTMPYKYELNGVETQLTAATINTSIDKLTSQAYSLIIKDVNGCESKLYNVNITEPEELVINVDPLNTGIDCSDVASGTIVFSIAGGRENASGDQTYSVIVSPKGQADIVIGTVTNNTGGAITINNPLLQSLAPNTYIIKVKDLESNAVNKCEVTQEVNLEVIKATADVTDATCYGVNNGTITNVQLTGVTGAYTFVWSSPDGGVGIDNANLNQSGLSAGTYQLAIAETDRACTVTFDFVVDYKHTLNIKGDVTDVICNGESSGAINIELQGGGVSTSYAWTGPSGFTFGDATQEDQSLLIAGTYSVTAVTTLDSEQCAVSNNFTVKQPNEITFDSYFETTSCDPYQRTLIVDNVSGGIGAYDYSWNGPAFDPVVPVDPQSVLIEQGGTYTITVKDKNLCESSQEIIVPDEIEINPVINHVKCHGGNTGSIVLNITGGSGAYTFSWTGPDAYTSNLRNIDELYAGEYKVTITDVNEKDAVGSCNRVFTITVNEPDAIEIHPAIVHNTCNGDTKGQIEIEVTGGTPAYEYSWTPVVGINKADAKDQYNLPADTYTVTVKDNAQCIATKSIVVKEDAPIVLSINSFTETLCDGKGGAIDISVSGGSGNGFAFDWSTLDGSGIVQGQEDQTNLSGGTYTVEVSDLGDGRSCTASISQTLTHAISISNINITPVSCLGNDDGAILFDVNGGDGNYTYTWDAVIGDASRIQQGVRNQSGLSEGTYKVTIKDGRTDASSTDCQLEYTFEIVALNMLDINVNVSDSKMCYNEPGGSLEASVSGGSGNYKYYWDGIEGTNKIENLKQGVYELEVQDVDLGCSWIQSYEVAGPDAPLTIDNIDITDVNCYQALTGAINVTVSGGTVGAGYIYTWTGPSTASGSNPTGLAAGTYSVTVTDANGCTVDSGAIEITQPTSAVSVSNPVIKDATDNVSSDGEIRVDITGGTPAYDIKWYDDTNTEVGASNPLTGLSQGSYRIVATDSKGCYDELTATVSEPDAALAFDKDVRNVTPCNGNDNGSIHISRIYGGYPVSADGYRVQVVGPGVNKDDVVSSMLLENLVPGNYVVTITDAASVTVSETITISEPTPLSIATTKISDVDCFTGTTGEIEVLVNGGTPEDVTGNYRVEISSLEGYSSVKNDAKAGTAFRFANLPAGNYTITVKDHLSSVGVIPCEASDYKLITQPHAMVQLAVVGDLEICNGEDFNLTLNTTDWDFSNGNLNVSVYDGFTTEEYSVDESPFAITLNPTTSRTYEITRVAQVGNAACLKGETTGDKVQLTVHQLPQANLTGPSEVCEDGTVQLSATLSGTKPFEITWRENILGDSDTETVNANTYSFTHSPVSAAQYQIINIKDANGCSNSGNGKVDVSINDAPQVSLTGGSTICVGETTTLTITATAGIAPLTITYEANGTEGTVVIPSGVSIYSWDVTPSVTTEYKITSVVDAKGCSSTPVVPITTKVFVDQLPEAIEVINSVMDTDGLCQGVNGVDYYITPVKYATGYTWVAPAGVDIISGNGTASITVNISESFTGGYIRVYAQNSCGLSPTTEKWIVSKPLPEDITTAPTGQTDLCESATGIVYSITPADNATSYEWDLPAGFILKGDGTGSSILVDLDPLVPSTVGTIRVRAVNDCSSTRPWSPGLEVRVTPLPVPNAGNNERICRTTYTLNAVPVGANEQGEWTVIKGAAQFNSNADKKLPNPNVYNLSQGENIFVWTVTNTLTGCTLTDTVVINNDQLSLTAIVDQSPVCSGEATITGTALSSLVDADEGFWSFTTGGGSFDEASNNATTVRNLDLGINTMRWTVRKYSCESYAEVTVLNNQATESVIYDETSNRVALIDLPCHTDEVRISGSIPLGDETGYWRVESGSVTIDDVNSPSIHITSIQKGDNELSWNIQKGSCVSKSYVTIRNNELDVDAGIDRYTCNGKDVLVGTSPDTDDGVAGVWTTNNGAKFEDAHSYFTDVYDLASGENTFRWTMTRNGCESYDEVIIRNDEPSEAAIVGDVAEVEICGGEYQMMAVKPSNPGDIGVWSVVSGSGTFEDPTNPNTKVTSIGQGENLFRWTVSNTACQSAVDFTIVNLKVEAYAGVDLAVCTRTAQLNATTPAIGVGEWNVVPGEGEATFYPSRLVNNPSIGGMHYGENRFVWTVTYKGCVSRDTVTVSANVPNPVDAGSDQSILSTSAQLDATPPLYGTGTWTLVEGGGNISNPNILNPVVTDVRRGENIFRWTVDFNGCTDYDEVIITNGTTVDANAGVDQIVCDNIATLAANDPDVGIGEWSVKEGTGVFENIRDPESKVTNIAQGENIYVWTIYYTNSTTTDEVKITCNKPSEAVAGLDARVCGNEFELEAKPPVYGIPNWSVLSGGGVFDDVNDANTTVRSLAPGANILKLIIDNNGCQSLDTVIVYNDTPSIADAGSDQVVCTDSVEMKPVIPQYGEGRWKVVKGQGTGADGGEITGRWIYNLAPGENIFEWVVKVDDAYATCVSRDSVVVINNQPTESYAGQDRSVCTENITLSAGEAIYGTGTWELVSGSGTITDINSKNTEVTGLAKGKNRFRWTIDNNGCTSESEVQISYDLIEAIAGYDPEPICTDTIVLDANEASPGIGEWGIIGGSGSASFDNVNDPYTTVRNLDRGENRLTWSITYKACRSVDTIVVVNDMPSTAIAGNNLATCDSSIVLGASVPSIGDGVWTIQNGGGEFVDLTSETSRVNNLQFGDNIFRWTVTNNSCSSYDDVQVSYNRINSKITEDFLEICTDEQILSGNNASPGVGEWSVVSGNSQAKFEDNSDPTTNVYSLARGTNLLEWKIEYKGCTTRDTVTIINHNPSTAYAGSIQELCTDATTLRATSPAIGTGTWTVLSGSAAIDGTQVHNPTAQITNLSKGENTLQWTVLSDNGMCANTDQVTIYNNMPSTPFAGEDDEYCSPTVILKAATPDYGTGLWTIKDGSGNFDDPTLPGATITNLKEGENTFVWTVSVQNINGDIGCSASDEVTIINNTPTTANAGPDVRDCKDYTYLDANAPTQGTGTWSVVSGSGTFTDNADPKTYVEGLSFGENTLQWKIQNGSCISVDEIVIFNKVPTQAAAGQDKSTCDDYYPLNANTPISGEGTWSVVSGQGEFEDVHNPTTVVRGLGLGENTLKWSISYGDCTTEDVVVIQSNKAAPYAGEDDISYEPSYDLKASNPGSQLAQWTVIAGTGDFEDDTYYNTMVNNLSEGLNTFRWTMNVNGCVTYDDVSIQYRVVPDAAFTANYYDGCYPLEITFTNHSVGGSVFEWNFGDDTEASTQRNPVHTFEKPGTYNVVLTVPGPDDVDGIATHQIVVYDHPVADFAFGPETIYSPSGELDCRSLSIDATSYLWDFGDGGTSEAVNPRHKYSEEGVYSIGLEVWNQYGCTDDTLVMDAVTVINEGFLTFPTAFTPRPDGGSGVTSGVNDNSLFRPVYKDVDTYKLQVFNRWGQLIYESTNIDEGWNGFFDNQLAPQAVYVWKATGTYNSGRNFNKTGSVLLVR